MFGWRKRDQGFEWQQYVRTTIKLRREARKEKVEQIKQQAADGVKVAAAVAGDGIKAAGSVAADGARAAGAAAAGGARVAGVAAGFAARQSAQRLSSGSRLAAEAFGRGLRRLIAMAGSGLERLGHGIGEASQPLMVQVSRPPIQRALLAAGGILLAGALFRGWYLKLLDPQAKVVGAVGAAALVAAGLPRLLARGASPLPPWLGSLSPRTAFAALLVAGVSLLGASRFAPAGLAFPSLALPSFARLPSLPFAAPEVVEGRATIVSGDVIRIGTRGLRLSDIELPEREQTCARPNNRRWRCGEASLATLSRLVNGRTLKCEISGSDGAGTQLATCRDGTTDIAAELVRGGHAFAAAGLLSRHNSLEADAKTRRAGIWAGEALRPAEWRQRLWEEARRRAPSGCPIKGQVQGNARTYVLPWAADYERVRVNTQRGGRWFCSEEEAVSAGWTIASR